MSLGSDTMEQAVKDDENGYLQVSPLMLFPGTKGKFSIFLKQAGEYVLYTKENESFTFKHRHTLVDSGVSEIFILEEERDRYENYIEENLGNVLQDSSIDRQERASVLYTAGVDVMREVFDQRLPETLERKQFSRIATVVREAVTFLAKDNALKTVAMFINHDYKAYTHCVQVMVYAATMLATYGLDNEDLVQSCLGAMMHDLGKARVPRSILYKPGRLSGSERRIIETHPVMGVSMCTQIPVSSEVINCILFHHERLNGSGYPSGLTGESLPLSVRVIAIADVYDALTSNRPYSKAATPYQALSIMREGMGEALDIEVFKRFITLLSGAAII